MKINDVIQKSGSSISVKKNEHVFIQGDSDNNLYFVVDGLLKAYYLSKDGNEKIKSFIQTGGLIGSLYSAHIQQTCSFSLLALKDCNLVQVPFNTLQDAAKQSHDIALEIIEFLLGLSLKKERRENDFLNLDAEQRYQKFLLEYPELNQELTQNDIARYLGINPVSLSRIRKKHQ